MQKFANDEHFIEVYPMESKAMAGEALRQMGRDYGIMENLTIDGSKEQTAKGSLFMKTMKKNDVKFHIKTQPMPIPAQSKKHRANKCWLE